MMLVGTLFCCRIMIFVQFLLFLVMVFHFLKKVGVLISLHLLSHLAQVTWESEILQHMMILSPYLENNRDSIYETYVV